MKPLVLLNCNIEDGRAVLQTQYFDAVRAAGGIPLALPAPSEPDDSEIVQALGSANAVLLVGGDDYDPARWGEEKHPRTRPIHARREKFDPVLGTLARKQRLPVLGICAGHQALAIAAGSALIQHLGSDAETSPHAGGSRHGCRIEPGTLLARVLGGTSFGVNSFHHQAVDPRRLGPGLRVTAWAEAPIRLLEQPQSPDGQSRADPGSGQELPFIPSVEAIEAADGSPVIGVQWHPERIVAEPAGLPLFRWLVEEGRRRSKIGD